MSENNIIYVDLLDNVYLSIECERGQAFELKEFFSCYVPNYRYNPKFKNHMWDGKVSFFDVYNKTLPIGLLKYLKKFSEKYDYKIKFKFKLSELQNDITKEDLVEFYDALFDRNGIYPRDYQQEAIYKALKNKRGILEAATGCHAKGTRVVMYDGTLKNVENICIGDILMGPDNNPRIVQKLYRGIQQMYKITPNKGESFVVNEDHILHLIFTNDKCRSATKYSSDNIDISVKEYLKQHKTFKHESKLVYNNKPIIFDNYIYNGLDPYFVGLYLGDGHTYSIAITTMDDEIKKYIYSISDMYGCSVREYNNGSKATTYYLKTERGMSNPILEEFRSLGLEFSNKTNRTICQEKFIPDILKYSSITDRLSLLAGIIDSDGHLGNDTYYDIIMSSERLIDDIIFVSRSLGFYITKSIKIVNGVEYYRCTIQGDIYTIPVKLQRKVQRKLNRNKRIYVQGFKVEAIGVDEYYGFNLDMDHLYFTEDFCIHHNSGKSIMIYSILRFIMEDTTGKILIVVPSINLVNQLFSDFKEYGWYDSYDDVTLLYGKSKNYDPNKKVTISTWQSIHKKGQKFFNDFTGIIVDEAHGAKSLSIQTVLKKCINAEYKLGTTGTLPTEMVDKYNIYGYLGPVIYKLKSKTLIDKGFLSDIRIVNMHIKYPIEDIKLNKEQNYNEEVDFIINNEKRNKVFKYIIDSKYINNDKDNVLILAQRINHIDNIVSYLEETYPDKDILRIDGSTNPEERERVRKYIEDTDGVILVATYGTLSTGVNIPKLHHVIFASFYKSKIKVLQSIGRGLRKHKSKGIIIIWDLIDDMRWKKQVRSNTRSELGYNYAYQHYLERLKYYEEQGFKFLNKKIILNNL